MVTPAAMWARLIRRCRCFPASASWMRELTPRHSLVSSQASACNRPSGRAADLQHVGEIEFALGVVVVYLL